MFSLVLMTTSCCKDDPIPDPVVITVDDLVGNWDFVSLDFNGTTYTDCAEVLTGSGYEYVTFSLNVSESEIIIKDECINDVGSPWNYTLTNGIIDFLDGGFQFEIQNTDTFDPENPILELNLLTDSDHLLTGGIYTLEKQ